jgi:hypothetical protein
LSVFWIGELLAREYSAPKMSSRALRKLQRQQQQAQEAQENEVSDDDAPAIRVPAPKFNAFDLLGGEDAEEAEEEHESDASIEEKPPPADLPPSPPKPAKSKKKQKQKKKSKKGAPPADANAPSPTALQDEADDIDRALRDLAIQHLQHTDEVPFAHDEQADPDRASLCKILSIEPRKLNSMNEMKLLFGNIVLETRQSESPAHTPTRRRERNRQAVDLGRALTGQFSPASRGQSLAAAASRRNVLMQGKEEWPRAPSGGLGMEVVKKFPSDVTEYKLVHNTAYKGVQFEFDICVESMEPQRMIELLQYNRKSSFFFPNNSSLGPANDGLKSLSHINVTAGVGNRKASG